MVDLNDIQQAKQWYNEDYWERGPETGKSNYANWGICEDWDDKFVRHFDRAFPLAGKRVLDLGCALGGIVLALIKIGVEAFGIDLSEYAVEKGHRLYPILEHFTSSGSAHELPYLPEYFDVIHSNQVFEHIPETLVPGMLREMYRVMKPGGIAWVGLVFHEEQGNGDHITLKPIEWWKEQVEAAGFIFDMSLDKAFRDTGLMFFDEYGWDSISFRKPSSTTRD